MGRPWIQDVPIAQCDPPHRVTHDEKQQALAASLCKRGWHGPPLIGYRTDDGRIQLLSGSHRYAAAAQVQQMTLPVRVYPEWFVRALQGDTDRWSWLMTP